jgi:hypothetical protein
MGQNCANTATLPKRRAARPHDDHAGRDLHWASRSLTERAVLDAFAAYCRSVDELDVTELSPTALEVSWRGRETSIVEIAATPPGRPEPTLALTQIADSVVPRFLDDSGLRGRLALYDLVRLEKINASASAFVHFEWFLADEYGVKVVPLTRSRALVERASSARLQAIHLERAVR